MRTTTKKDWKFTYSISDLGKLLGKSPATLRGWENKGLIVFPRESGGDRTFSTKDVRRVAQFAQQTGRIKSYRRNFIESIMTMVEFIEYLNNENIKT